MKTRPVDVYEVTLVVKVPNPKHGAPSTWYWPDLIDCTEDEVEFVSENFIGTVPYEVDEDE